MRESSRGGRDAASSPSRWPRSSLRLAAAGAVRVLRASSASAALGVCVCVCQCGCRITSAARQRGRRRAPPPAHARLSPSHSTRLHPASLRCGRLFAVCPRRSCPPTTPASSAPPRAAAAAHARSALLPSAPAQPIAPHAQPGTERHRRALLSLLRRCLAAPPRGYPVSVLLPDGAERPCQQHQRRSEPILIRHSPTRASRHPRRLSPSRIYTYHHRHSCSSPSHLPSVVAAPRHPPLRSRRPASVLTRTLHLLSGAAPGTTRASLCARTLSSGAPDIDVSGAIYLDDGQLRRSADPIFLLCRRHRPAAQSLLPRCCCCIHLCAPGISLARSPRACVSPQPAACAAPRVGRSSAEARRALAGRPRCCTRARLLALAFLPTTTTASAPRGPGSSAPRFASTRGRRCKSRR
jgi:hypothetical protein